MPESFRTSWATCSIGEDQRRTRRLHDNQGDANADMGWGISEGEWVDYSAAGKSATTVPIKRPGRTFAGRPQGMADGEVMSRSGKINEGTEPRQRRTQDSNQSGDVEEEGHSDAVARAAARTPLLAGQGNGGRRGRHAPRLQDRGVQSREHPRPADAQRGGRVRAGQLNNMRTYDLKK
jgi:hypothetical protein